MLRTLVGYNHVAGAPGNKLVPDLATSVPKPTNGGKTYTFHLRSGMKWSDGAPIDANVFAYSINRSLDPCTGSDVASYLYNIKGAADFNGGTCPEGAKVSTVPAITVAIAAAATARAPR